jgi:choline dehydrogenase
VKWISRWSIEASKLDLGRVFKETWEMITTIVVGAGASGGALASRLTEDAGQHVILIEAGPDYPGDVPAALRDVNALDLTGLDWGLRAYTDGGQTGIPSLPYLGGRVVGGSSTVTATATRPIPEDFDAWVVAAGQGWSWEAVSPYFRRLENDLDYRDPRVHGHNGPITVQRSPREQWPRLLQAFQDACVALGHPVCEDSNHEKADGVGPAPRNMLPDGDRASTLSTYLRSARGRANLEIRADTTVERIVFDGHRAIGVEARRHDQHTAEHILADRVVLCAGALKTPQILMLSGIGPGEHLSGLGIDVLADLPVGRTLVDHPTFKLLGLASDSNPSSLGPRAHLQYSSGSGHRNDMWIIAALVAPGPPAPPFPPEVKGIALLLGVLAKPLSRGSLTLSSADPSTQPVIRLNYLDDEADRERARKMMRMMYEMATSSPVAPEISTVLQPPAGVVTDDDQLDNWLRDNVGSMYHAACTCPMGTRETGTSVVDRTLAVHDTEALYIADASVFPEIPTSAAFLPSLMVAEHLADQLGSGH